MSLIRKTVTTALAKANRENSQKSTGPRTELGKKYASRNAIKHMIRGSVLKARMKDLGEDPKEFEKLQLGLYQTFQPEDEFERILVEDMAEIRWRRQRLIRAESGIQAGRVKKFEFKGAIEKEKRGGDWTMAFAAPATALIGAAGSAQTVEDYQFVADTLMSFERGIRLRGFRKEAESMLRMLYGKSGSLIGLLLIDEFLECCNDPSPDSAEALKFKREIFLERARDERVQYEELVRIHASYESDRTPAARDGEMLVSGEELEKIIRYEAALERNFERKVQQLVAWRRAKGNDE